MCAREAPNALHYGGDVVDDEGQAVRARIWRHIRRRVTARVESNATVRAREPSHLRFPSSIVAVQFMNEDDRVSVSGFFRVQPHAIRIHKAHVVRPSIKSSTIRTCLPDKACAGAHAAPDREPPMFQSPHSLSVRERWLCSA